ncbi:MAG TPA: DUF1707 domain-containing protein [Streptosporangiaceae bacterium]|nr:DUF1707 domain-containing protein [Streptosporangiaceae bacterium]
MMSDNMRISDADRERVTARLRDHYAEGRLTADELDERVTATLNAKTVGDLRPIMADLPEPGPVGPQAGPPPQHQDPRYAYQRGPRLVPVALLLLLFSLLILPGAGWAFFAFIKIALLAWVVLCVAGIFAAARFRRRARRSRRSWHDDQWHHHGPWQ